MISTVQILCLPLHDGFILSTVHPSKLILPVVSLRYLITEVMKKERVQPTQAGNIYLFTFLEPKLSHTGKPKVSMGERYVVSPRERKET